MDYEKISTIIDLAKKAEKQKRYDLVKALQDKVIAQSTKNSGYDLMQFAREVKSSDKVAIGEAICKNSEHNLYVYQFASEFSNYIDVAKLQNAMISKGINLYLVDFARYVKGADIRAIEKAIIKSNDPKVAYYFAKYVKGANVEALQNVVLKYDILKYLYQFAKDVKGADVNLFARKVAELTKENRHGYQYDYETVRDTWFYAPTLYDFSKIKGVDLEIIKDAFIEMGYVDYCFKLAKNFGYDEKLEDAVIKHGSVDSCYDFGKFIKGANRKKLSRVIADRCLNNNNPDSKKNLFNNCCFFANLKGADKKVLQGAVLNSNDPDVMTNFAMWADCADIEVLQDGVIKAGNAIDLYYFALKVKGADVKKLGKIVARIGNANDCIRFAQLKGADKLELYKAVLASKDEKAIARFESTIYFKKLDKIEKQKTLENEVEKVLNTQDEKTK